MFLIQSHHQLRNNIIILSRSWLWVSNQVWYTWCEKFDSFQEHNLRFARSNLYWSRERSKTKRVLLKSKQTAFDLLVIDSMMYQLACQAFNLIDWGLLRSNNFSINSKNSTQWSLLNVYLQQLLKWLLSVRIRVSPRKGGIFSCKQQGGMMKFGIMIGS